MRKIFLLISLSTFSLLSMAQLSGTKTIPGDFASIASAVTTLNAGGVGPGGVTFNVAAGYTETPSGPIILTISSNPPSATKPVIFQRSGAGANPLITAFTPGVSTTLDGIFIINGADYVTIDGIDLQENALNTTATQQMEWGYALVKTAATNGSQYNTIKNCSVTLNKANTASVGIYIGNHTSISTTALTLTSFSGTSSYNKFYNNTVQNSFHGIDLNGYTGAVAPYDYYDQGNEIGATGTGRNQVLNFGGGASGTANGITCNAQSKVKIFRTNIDNSGGAATSTTINGILTGTGTNASVDIYNDTVALSSTGTTTTMVGINNGSGGTGAGNTINIYNCMVKNCTYSSATSAEFRGIAQTATASYTNIHDNTVTNNTIPGTGQWSGIYYGGNSSPLCLNVAINNNTINGNTKTGTSGQFNCIYASSSTYATTCSGNLMYNNAATASTSTMYGYYNFAFCFSETVTNNQYYNNSSGTGVHVGLFVSSGSGPTDKLVTGNIVHDMTGAAQVGGIFCDYGTNSTLSKNNVYNITSSATALAPGVYGIGFGSASTNTGIYNLYDNYISDLKTPANTSTSSIYGIWAPGVAACTYNIYNNSVYLNATSSSVTTFGTAGIFLGSTSLSNDMRNNIVVNNSVPGPTGGNTVALQRNIVSLSNYALTSGNNNLYAGTPAANRLIYNDGTNSDQTLQDLKNRVGPREQASFSELPPFVNIGAAPYDLHLQTGTPTQCEKGGKPVALVANDYDGDARNGTFPDVGADEIAGTTNDIASPDIQYALLGNSGVAATRSVPSFATITDPSGINTTAGTKPRLYYKKSTQGNTFNDNTNVTDGWKYVEASNASSPFNFTVDYSLLLSGSVSAGDIIQYFVTAQDLNVTPRIGLNNGGFTLQPTTVNLAAANFPLNNTINQYTIVANAYSGVIPVGPTETITSLTNVGGMFDLINTGSVKGNVTISITGDLTAETGTIPLNQWAESEGAGFTVTISPSAAVNRTISGSHATLSLIRLDGADRVNIDGRFGGSGSYLTFRNTSNAAPTIGMINDAQSNTIRNSIIESGNTSTATTTAGAIFLGTTTGTQGNDNNTITNNEIRDRSDVAATPTIGINCAGTTTSPTHANSGVTISDNNIHDWYLLNGAAQFGISIGTGNTNFTITGNSFYQTAPRNHTAAGAVTRAISINNAAAATTSGGHIVSGNFIGGTAPGATGGNWTTASTSTQTFGGISITTGLIPSTIQNNLITKINYTTIAPSANTTMFFGISATQGNFTIQGNTIGATSGTGALLINVNTGGASSSFLAGVLSAAVNGTHNITGNNIGGWTLGGTNTTASWIPQYIQVQGTPTQNFSVTNNVIGSTVTPNSILNTTLAPNITFGIRVLITTGPTVTISGNTIQNVTDLSTAATSADYGMLFINQVGGTAPLLVSNNTISNFIGNSSAATATINVYGISVQGYSGNQHVFSGNTISGISNTNTGAFSGYTMGIQVQGNNTGGTMSKNKIFNLSNANTGSGPGLAGIYFTAGDGWTASNNMVSINNGAGVNGLNVYGIAEYCAGAFNMFYNSVYIGGTSAGTFNTYAYERGNNSRLSLKNNLLYNERTGGTGLHYALGNSIAVPTDGWTNASSSYNTFFSSSSAAIGEWGTGVQQSFAQWKTSSGGDNESYADVPASAASASLFTNTGTGDLNINPANSESWYVNGKAVAGAASNSIATDFAGDARGITVGTPTDIGADEFTPNAGVLPPNAIADAAPALSTTTTYSFGGRTLGQITWGATGTVPTLINWKYYSGITPVVSGATPINSQHDVPNVNNDGSGYTYSMKQYFTDAEQNQIPDALLEGMKNDGSGWVGIAGTLGNDAAGKFVTSTGLTGFSKFSLKTGAIVAVKIISFTGKANANGTGDLFWSVAQQAGITNYTVERSAGDPTFKAIGSRLPNGSANGNYQLTDYKPITGKNYYRLRMTDNSGNISYSNIILLNFGKEEITVSPNPARDKTVLTFSNNALLNTMAEFVDAQGKILMQQKIERSNQTFDVSGLKAGVYFIRLVNGTVLRFVKL